MVVLVRSCCRLSHQLQNVGLCEGIRKTRPHALIWPRNRDFTDSQKFEKSPAFSNGKRNTIHVQDRFLCVAEASQLVGFFMGQTFLPQLFSSPGERKAALPSEDDDLLTTLGALSDNGWDGQLNQPLLKFASLLNRIRERVKAEVVMRKHELLPSTSKAVKLTEAGCIFSWLSPPGGLDKGSSSETTEESYSYMVPHCDKNNKPEYDITALVYLNDHTQQQHDNTHVYTLPRFSGGDLHFMGDDPDSKSCSSQLELVLQPRQSRLVLFGSDDRNFHRVGRVTSGDRFLLSVWYSATTDSAMRVAKIP